MSKQSAAKNEEPRRSKYFREFKGVFTRSTRNAMPEGTWYNLENLQPIGDGNIQVVNNISAVKKDYGLDIIYLSQYVNVAGTDYLISFSTNGKVFAYNIGSATSTQIKTGFAGAGSRVVQWKNTQALFIDASGYYSWDGTTFSAVITGVGVPATGTDIAVFAGRVWIVNGRLLTFSGADDFTAPAFLVANGAGSLALTDPTLRKLVTRLFASNGYLYIVGSTNINVISDVYVPSGAVPPTPLFTNLNIQGIIGSDQPFSFFIFNRALMFANRYGAWGINGVQAERISEDIDGTWKYVDFTQPVSGGQVVSNNILCSAFLIKRLNDPKYGSNTVLAMFHDKKWWFGNYGALTFVTSAIAGEMPSLFGFLGNKLYQLFADNTTAPATTWSTPLWPMEDPLADKEVIRAGFEVTVSIFSGTFTMTLDSVNNQYAAIAITQGGNVSWQNNGGNIVQWQNNALAIVNWFSSAYLLYSGTAPGGYQKYAGLTGNASGSQYQLSGTFMDYKLRARW